MNADLQEIYDAMRKDAPKGGFVNERTFKALAEKHGLIAYFDRQKHERFSIEPFDDDAIEFIRGTGAASGHGDVSQGPRR